MVLARNVINIVCPFFSKWVLVGQVKKTIVIDFIITPHAGLLHPYSSVASI